MGHVATKVENQLFTILGYYKKLSIWLYFIKVAPIISLPGFSSIRDAVLKGTTHFVLSEPFMIFSFFYGTTFLKSLNHEYTFSNLKNGAGTFSTQVS